MSRRAGEVGSGIGANEAMNKSFMWIFTFMRDGEYNSSDVRTDMKWRVYVIPGRIAHIGNNLVYDRKSRRIKLERAVRSRKISKRRRSSPTRWKS